MGELASTQIPPSLCLARRFLMLRARVRLFGRAFVSLSFALLFGTAAKFPVRFTPSLLCCA